MKKLFCILLALPMLMVACEPEPAPTPDEKSYELTITSELEMNFEAEGGNGVIAYEVKEITRNNPVPQPEVKATCEAKWVSDVTVAEEITFVVAANEGEARDTKVVVTFGEQSFDVAVKQAAKAKEPEPEPEYAMELEFAAAIRYPSSEVEMPEHSYVLYFADDAERYEFFLLISGEEGETALKAGKYAAEDAYLYDLDTETETIFIEGEITVGIDGDIYTFDMVMANEEGGLYHFTYEGTLIEEEPEPTPEPQDFTPIFVEAYRSQSWELGNFELDLYINNELYHSLDMQDTINPNDGHLTAGLYTMDNGGITDWSNFVWNIETGEGAYMTDAEITITHYEDGTTNLKGFIESEYGDHLDIDWTGVIDGFTFGGETPEPPTPGEGLDFTAPYMSCEYYSAGSMGTPSNNYWVILSDDEACNTQNPAPGATYIVLDLYSDAEQDSLPLGTYTFDANDSGENNTLGFYYSYGLVMSESGEPQAWYGFSDGTVTITEGKIYAELTREDNGGIVTVTYEGDLTFSGGSDDGGTEGALSTLEGDLELNLTGASISAEYYGDFYGVGSDNWSITVVEDAATYSGKYIQFDLLTDPASDDWRGEYISIDEATQYNYTFITGSLNNGYLSGSWYAELENGDVAGDMAPLTYGTVNFVIDEDGTRTITLDCEDDAGNKITGTITSATSAETYATRSTKKNLIPVKRSVVIR